MYELKFPGATGIGKLDLNAAVLMCDKCALLSAERECAEVSQQQPSEISRTAYRPCPCITRDSSDVNHAKPNGLCPPLNAA